MNCLSCRHMLFADHEGERVYRCGHDATSTLDSHEPAAVIARVNWFSDPDIRRPAWCPYQVEPLPTQKELFDDPLDAGLP